MAHDVFLSYRRDDLPLAKLRALSLETAGLSVWWDRDLLPTGEMTFDAMIEQRLNEASSVVVAWSRRAVESAWVKAEAEEGRKAEKLLQVRLDSAPLPLPFSTYHCASLEGWSGDATSPEIAVLVGAIRRSMSPRRKLTQVHNYYRPPEDIPTYGYKLDPPYRFGAIRASLRPRELLMCFLQDPTGAVSRLMWKM
jgi:hypothetical protein